jgi:Fibronectin type III domain.
VIFVVFTAPGPPENVEAIALTSSKVRVTWQHPDGTNGKLTKFKLYITLKSSGLKNKPKYETSKIESVPYDMKNYTFEVSTTLITLELLILKNL